MSAPKSSQQRQKPPRTSWPVIRLELAEEIGRLMDSVSGSIDERIATVIKFAQNALVNDEYFAICRDVAMASKVEIAKVSQPHAHGPLLQCALIGRGMGNRVKILNDLECLALSPDTSERHMHQALEGQLWVFGNEYTFISSNQTLCSIVEDYIYNKYTGEDASNRPDIFLGCDNSNKNHLLIEFKRPSMKVGRGAEFQAVKYADTITSKLAIPVDILIVGGEVDPRLVNSYTGGRTKFISYRALIANARAQVEWLTTQLKAHT